MQTELIARAISIYEKAVELRGDELVELLDRECGANKDLRREVERYLAFGERTGESSQLISRLDPDLFEERDPDELFCRFQEIGNYKIEKLIGEGGMGTVYLGVRTDLKSQMKVAIKVFKNGWNETLRKRFRAEREILSNLKHPNIASFIDCGALPVIDTPYLVMEYVEGVPLDVYCERQLSLKKRLGIFQQICEAVGYSHRHFIVHRDLKPSNILVTADGVPKLLDFGIAKIINPETVQLYELEKTNPLFSLMTPLYASPEQIDNKEPISVASDVFALGLILYKILTGRLPYPAGCDRLRLLDCIRNQEPEKPSAVRRRAQKQTSSQTPSNNPVSPSLQEMIPADIDNIVLKALEKDPARRYLSVEYFSEDINRYFKGLPVMARPHTFFYRTGKFFRRNKIGISIAAAFLLLLSFGAAAFLSQAAQTARERDKAQKVSDFLTNLFEQSDPYIAKGENATIREILNHGAQKIEREMNDQPEVQARLLHVMGRTFHRIGVFDRATGLQEKALGIYREKLNPNDSDAAEAMNDLAMTYMRLSKSPQDGFLNKAESLLNEALGIERTNRGNTHPSVAKILQYQVWLYISKRQLPEAEKVCHEALRIYLENFGEENKDVAETINILGIVYLEQERHDEAEKSFRRAMSINRKLYPENDLRAIPPRENLAWVLKEKGNFAESEPEFRFIINVYKERLPNGNPESAGTIVGLGMLLLESNRFNEAEPVLREGLEMRRKMLGEKHWETVYTRSELGWCLANLRQFEQAENYILEGLPFYIQRDGKKGADTVRMLERLVKLYEMWGKPAEAEKYRARLRAS